MRRKLRTSFTALAVAAFLLAVGAFATAAMPLSTPAVAHAAIRAVPAALPSDAPATLGTERPKSRAGRTRHSAGMPYFSFVPRG
jgi:hypothetical protein